MTKKEMNELEDIIVEKLIDGYIKEQSAWYTTTTLHDNMENMFKKPKKRNTETELLGELASLMTQMNIHMEQEEYEKCAKIKKKIDIINKKLGNK